MSLNVLRKGSNFDKLKEQIYLFYVPVYALQERKRKNPPELLVPSHSIDPEPIFTPSFIDEYQT